MYMVYYGSYDHSVGSEAIIFSTSHTYSLAVLNHSPIDSSNHVCVCVLTRVTEIVTTELVIVHAKTY